MNLTPKTDVVDFERRLRQEEDFYYWEIDEKYLQNVTASFDAPAFSTAISYLAYQNGQVIGRIDAVLLPSHFDGGVKAYLDWICVLKSARHQGVAQALLSTLREELRRCGVSTLVGLIAANEEAQRFYRAIPGVLIRDEGLWLDP